MKIVLTKRGFFLRLGREGESEEENGERNFFSRWGGKDRAEQENGERNFFHDVVEKELHIHIV